MKINTAACGLAIGVWAGGGLFLLTWWLILLGADAGTMRFLETAYPGYAMSPAGSFVGLAWGFVDGTISGIVLAWLYNLFAARFGSSAA